MDIKLVIPKKIHNKYTYLLSRYKNLEWSGPAWYKVKTDEDGFPIEWKIIHFHTLDLGSHAATEWEAKDLAAILKETYASMPSLKKSYMGLIHSHNTMGAFLSGTDTSTITDMAPDVGFYGSLVVASAGKATHAFGFSYKDQYKFSHCLEIDEDDIEVVNPAAIPQDEWVAEADLIEKKKPTPALGSQTQLWKQRGITSYKAEDANSYLRSTVLGKLSKAQKEKVEKILLSFDEGTLTEIECEGKLERQQLSTNDIASLMGAADYYGYSRYIGGYNGIY